MGPGRSFKEWSGVWLNMGCRTSVLVSMWYVRVVGGLLFSSVCVFVERVGGENGRMGGGDGEREGSGRGERGEDRGRD